MQQNVWMVPASLSFVKWRPFNQGRLCSLGADMSKYEWCCRLGGAEDAGRGPDED